MMISVLKQDVFFISKQDAGLVYKTYASHDNDHSKSAN